MDICDSGHEQIVYDSKVCPLCIAIDESLDKDKQIEKLEKELKEIEMA